MKCDACGREVGEHFYCITISDRPDARAVTCLRQRCGRKAFAIAELRFAAAAGRTFERARLSKWGIA